jgi:hypothetical protein
MDAMTRLTDIELGLSQTSAVRLSNELKSGDNFCGNRRGSTADGYSFSSRWLALSGGGQTRDCAAVHWLHSRDRPSTVTLD